MWKGLMVNFWEQCKTQKFQHEARTIQMKSSRLRIFIVRACPLNFITCFDTHGTVSASQSLRHIPRPLSFLHTDPPDSRQVSPLFPRRVLQPFVLPFLVPSPSSGARRIGLAPLPTCSPPFAPGPVTELSWKHISEAHATTLHVRDKIECPR